MHFARLEWLALAVIVLQCLVVGMLAIRRTNRDQVTAQTQALLKAARASNRCTDALLRTHQGQELMNISNRLLAERLRLYEAKHQPPPTEQSA